jgi:hypothetical protein
MEAANMEQIFLQLKCFLDVIFDTLLCVARVQKANYFLCPRRRMVSSSQRETNWSHCSRIVLRVPGKKKKSVGQLKSI